jgi:hypothetical protein
MYPLTVALLVGWIRRDREAWADYFHTGDH